MIAHNAIRIKPKKSKVTVPFIHVSMDPSITTEHIRLVNAITELLPHEVPSSDSHNDDPKTKTCWPKHVRFSSVSVLIPTTNAVAPRLKNGTTLTATVTPPSTCGLPPCLVTRSAGFLEDSPVPEPVADAVSLSPKSDPTSATPPRTNSPPPSLAGIRYMQNDPRDSLPSFQSALKQPSISKADTIEQVARNTRLQIDLLRRADLDKKKPSKPSSVARPIPDRLHDFERVSFKNRHLDDSALAENFTACIQVLPEPNHIQLWDQKPTCLYVFPSEFHLSCKNTGMFGVAPSVACVQLECRTLNPSRYSRSNVTPYAISCTGQQVQLEKMSEKKGIHIDPIWIAQNPTDSKVDGWFFTFWTPIPISLFSKAETRTFHFTVRLGLGRGAMGGILSAEKTLSISHLNWPSRDTV